ncbi:hypothetical protein CPB84DRAFT_1669124 [Gymnopilus junonius]|uniref:MYND-type domain-containing protein n=1 Tax=Gymnopilus junonius TaxID=109634 RepID=A0A9P5TV98_GYMJU|nr:hypothetical protein CPB84DRAFT_1669124 [Gymnopilus junonius]
MAHPVLWPKKTFFYPIGNTPPVCFTQDLAPELKADVLLLACGDPRSILYTVYADITPHNRLMDFTCCDWEPAVLARNVLLLTMAADGISSSNMWCIFYHFFLDQTSYEVLLAQCRSLVQLSSDMAAWKRSKYGEYLRFCTEHTLAEVRRHWLSYIEIDDLTNAEKKALRVSFDSGMQKVRGMMTTMGSIRSAGALAPSFVAAGINTHENFWSSGITPSGITHNVRTPHINPTFAFCQAGQIFNVHYGTDPLLCFHLAPALTSIKGAKSAPSPTMRIFVELAMTQFSSWCSAFKKRISTNTSANITIRFFVGESLSFCQALRSCRERGHIKTGIYTLPWGGTQIEFNSDDYAPSSQRAPLTFNVIDTSNLADHTGLLNLLVMTTPLLEKLPWSTLHTNTLLPSSRAGSPTSGLASKSLADIPTLSMLLGIAPYPHFSHFVTHSNKHEIIASPIISGQLLEPISWKIPPCSIPGPMMYSSDLNSKSLVCNADKLGHFLFSVYMKMFSEEDMLGNILNISLESVRKMNTVHYVRQSLAAFFRLVKERVVVDWAQAMSTFFDLLESDQKLMMGPNNYQDLICHLYLRNLFTPMTMEPGFIEDLRGSYPGHPCFEGWEDVPSVVCIMLKVPRTALQCLEDIDADEILTPILQCESRTPQGHNVHSSIQPIFGDFSTSYLGHVGITEDQRAWRGNSSLIVTFYMPTWIILSNKPQTVIIGLNMRSTPSAATLFLHKLLGPNLNIYSTNLADEEHIRVVRHRPDNLEDLDCLQKLSTVAKSYDQSSPKTESVVLNFDDPGTKVATLTIHHDIMHPGAVKALSEGANVAMKPQNDTSVMVSFHSFSEQFKYPVPIWSSRAKCRVARKSSYIEVEIPVRPSFEDFLEFSLNPFPVARYNDTVNILNIHYVNMDHLPALKLPMAKDKLDWLSPHLGCAFSADEKQVKERPNQEDRGVLVNIKESISAIFIDHVGLRGQRDNIFGLSDPKNGGIYALIFVNDIKLDLPSHTIVADACVVPLYNAIMGKISSALQRLTNKRFHQVVTLEDEAKVWRLLLPVLAERCRTWKHLSKCEYLSDGIPVALEGPDKSPLCSCGKGKNLGSFGSIPEWKVLHKEATRIAISPLFSFSFMEDMVSAMKNSINKLPNDRTSAPTIALSSSKLCSNCGSHGKPKLMVCSRCKKAKYCSQSCQNAHWKAHKRLCVLS